MLNKTWLCFVFEEGCGFDPPALQKFIHFMGCSFWFFLLLLLKHYCFFRKACKAFLVHFILRFYMNVTFRLQNGLKGCPKAKYTHLNISKRLNATNEHEYRHYIMWDAKNYTTSNSNRFTKSNSRKKVIDLGRSTWSWRFDNERITTWEYIFFHSKIPRNICP